MAARSSHDLACDVQLRVRARNTFRLSLHPGQAISALSRQQPDLARLPRSFLWLSPLSLSLRQCSAKPINAKSETVRAAKPPIELKSSLDDRCPEAET